MLRSLGIFIAFTLGCFVNAVVASGESVERWGRFEVTLKGPSDGNPFADVTLTAHFEQGDKAVEVAGFYDGEGVYRIRFMPAELGQWHYTTKSNRAELSDKSGTFTCEKPAANNHGPVHVHNTFHFAYADGSPYFQIGTTCYSWIHQRDELQRQTLATLKTSPFNKIRMCVLPTRIKPELDEPILWPFEGMPPTEWDFTHPNPKFFRMLDQRVGELRDLGVEADIILFHPYARPSTGLDRMNRAGEDAYLKYIIARLSAYRNVWWSLANECDLMREKTDADWDHFGQLVMESDPFNHLRSIHNCVKIYNNTMGWVTHASIQNGSAVEDFGRAELYREVYRKPVVFDEVKYEGNAPDRWGQLTGQEMVDRFWQGTIAGTYVGHGDVFRRPNGVDWLSTGGVLDGQSHVRLAFLKKVFESAPPDGINPIDKWQDLQTAGKAGEYYLVYFGRQKPAEWRFELPKAGLSAGMRFSVEILDTWNMSVTPVPGEFRISADDRYRYHSEGMGRIQLPGEPYIALRIQRIR